MRVGAGPEGLGDEPGAQRMPTELVDLRGGEPRGGRAAVDHFVDRVSGHRGGADGAGGVYPREQRPGRVGRLVDGRRGSSAAARSPPPLLPHYWWRLGGGGRSS